MLESQTAALSREARELQEQGKYLEASEKYEQVAEHWRSVAQSTDEEGSEHYGYLADYWEDVADSARTLAEVDELMQHKVTYGVSFSRTYTETYESLPAKAVQSIKRALGLGQPAQDAKPANVVSDQLDHPLRGTFVTRRTSSTIVSSGVQARNPLKPSKGQSYVSDTLKRPSGLPRPGAKGIDKS